jgi:Na+/H+-dicarboxylate symporter
MTPRRPAEARRRRPAVGDGERIGERLIAIFCLGLVLFSPLVIDIFDRGPQVRVFGSPLLYFYLFAAWAVMIGLLAWVLERPAAQGNGSTERTRNRADGDGALQ